jgi:hypothetical protein
MKLSESNKKLLKTVEEKHGLKNESVITQLFGLLLKKKLNNDPSINKAIKDADNELSKIKKYVQDKKDKGEKIPDFLQKWVK